MSPKVVLIWALRFVDRLTAELEVLAKKLVNGLL
jgi:hypothetical protein